jgi:hypothetical protein
LFSRSIGRYKARKEEKNKKKKTIKKKSSVIEVAGKNYAYMTEPM